jgi:hypothetical protein
MKLKAQALKPILHYPNRTIAQLSLQISQQLAILARIRAVLPKELEGHVLHCVYNNKKLLVYTDSANWASQLRFHSKTMLAACGQSISASVLQVKIIGAMAITSPKRKALIPPQAVADEIHSQGLITSDPQLKQALNKLGTTLTRLQARK